MNTREQLFATGFVKRAIDHGFSHAQAVELFKMANTENEKKSRQLKALLDNKASVPLQALFSASLPGMYYNLIKDINAPAGVPSRTSNIYLPTGIGALGGLVLGGALGGGGATLLGLPAHATENALLMGANLGGLSGIILGGAYGARKHNRQIDELIKRKGLE